MRRLNITAKIWLSVGIFAAGFVASTVLGQIQGRSAEMALQTASAALFPAAQRSQEAESAFQRAAKGFSDAVLVQDASALQKAADEGRAAVEQLTGIAAIPGIPDERGRQARQLGSEIGQFVEDASTTYGKMLANPASMSAVQGKMRELASRTDQLKTMLRQTTELFSQDLHQQLSTMKSSSARQRSVALAVFGVTLVLSFAIVTITIRRAITGPITRVIHGVQEAANAAADASNRVSSSGESVAKDAQDQAAYIQETSASLEEISAVTRQNAQRAVDADGLMQGARQTVDRAGGAMNDLTASMEMIARSSRQVADVLKSINGIAFHTNILALNAAVEAARAGDAGAGFSVVADEVRSLAQRAAEAARQSAEIIEKTVADVSRGVALVTTARDAFGQVSTAIASSSQVVSEIAAASHEQSRGVSHIGDAVSRMGDVTQNNAVNARQAAEAASAMTTQIDATRRHLDELVQVVGLRET